MIDSRGRVRSTLVALATATVVAAVGVVTAGVGPSADRASGQDVAASARPVDASISAATAGATASGSSATTGEPGTPSTVRAPLKPATASSRPTTAAKRSSTGSPSTRRSTTSRPPSSRPSSTRPSSKPSKKPSSTPTTAPGVSPGSGGGKGSGRIRYGVTYGGVATYYVPTGQGNCSYDTGDTMYVAMNQQDYDNSRACGAYLEVTGPKGKVTVKVVDRCPECPVGALDLSKQAFAKLADLSVGRMQVTWRLLSPSLSGPVSYRYKTGSSRYWCGIQVLNHRNPIRSLAVKVGDDYKDLDRKDYNYFLSENGAGCGGTIRVTDIYGNQLTDTGITVSPDRVQAGKAQFGGPR